MPAAVFLGTSQSHTLPCSFVSCRALVRIQRSLWSQMTPKGSGDPWLGPCLRARALYQQDTQAQQGLLNSSLSRALGGRHCCPKVGLEGDQLVPS